MRISVLINNFNYGRFVRRAVRSVLDQQLPPHEIIVVDDGSTDESGDVLAEIARNHSMVRVITKENGGQLSAFNAGFAVATGDIICFLDADDEYLPNYLYRIHQTYSTFPKVDFVYCTLEFYQDGSVLGLSSNALESFDHGISFFRTLILGDWVGAPTSGLSARRSLLERVLPCPLERNWRIRADDVLVVGAAMTYGRKFHLAETLVRYHVHGKNAWFGSAQDLDFRLKRRLERHEIAGYFAKNAVVSLSNLADWSRLLNSEFRTIPCPRREDISVYATAMSLAHGRSARLWKWKMEFKLIWSLATRRLNSWK